MVYRRQIGNDIVAFGHQGSVWKNAMVIYDHLTGSVWSQPYGRPIMGELTDVELDFVPSTMTTWGEWKAVHPDTLAYKSDYRYITKYEVDGAVLDRSTIVVKYFGDVVSYPTDVVRQRGSVQDVVGGLDVVIALVNSEPGTMWNVFLGQLGDGTDLDLETDSSDPSTIVDTLSGTRWTVAHGRGVEGLLMDQDLIVLPASMLFTRQFLVYYPDGRVFEDS